MALVGYEWMIVVAILLVIFLWGPQKLPELARSMGQAKKEFDKAAKEYEAELKKAATTTSETSTTTTTETARQSDEVR